MCVLVVIVHAFRARPREESRAVVVLRVVTVVEMKLKIVRRKLAPQLDEVLHGEGSLKSQMKQKRELDMCERIIGRKNKLKFRTTQL